MHLLALVKFHSPVEAAFCFDLQTKLLWECTECLDVVAISSPDISGKRLANRGLDVVAISSQGISFTADWLAVTALNFRQAVVRKKHFGPRNHRSPVQQPSIDSSSCNGNI